jgi:hypothetical protein
MPRKTSAKRITRTVTVLFSTMLLGAAVPAASLASANHAAHAHKLHVAAGKGDPYTRSVVASAR